VGRNFQAANELAAILKPMLVAAVSESTHQGQWGIGVLTMALQTKKKLTQGQSQPHENQRPHKGVTKTIAVPQLAAIAGALKGFMSTFLTRREGVGP
jgi:hypothetical protein